MTYQARTGKGKLVALPTFSSDPDDYGDCDYAVIEVTPELVELVRRRAALLEALRAQDEHAFELWFRGGYEPMYFDSTLYLAVVEKADEDEAGIAGEMDSSPVAIPPGVDLEGIGPQRTTGEQMIVSQETFTGGEPRFEVQWSCTPKGSSLEITTLAMSIDDLAKFLDPDRPTPVTVSGPAGLC